MDANARIDLQRVTTEFVEDEDRIRLSGELAPGETLVLWVTQRLAQRLVPHLCQWLEKQTAAGAPVEVVQGFAQQAALAALERQEAVRVEPGTQDRLVRSVDLTFTESAVYLLFKTEVEGPVAARVGFNAKPLRQWLGILLAQYRRGQWPLSAWPDWMTETRAPAVASQTAVLH